MAGGGVLNGLRNLGGDAAAGAGKRLDASARVEARDDDFSAGGDEIDRAAGVVEGVDGNEGFAIFDTGGLDAVAAAIVVVSGGDPGMA